MTRKNTTQTIHTATKIVTIAILIWIVILSGLTLFNSYVIIKKEMSKNNNNLPPLMVLEYLEV